jgi:hypothetical protein
MPREMSRLAMGGGQSSWRDSCSTAAGLGVGMAHFEASVIAGGSVVAVAVVYDDAAEVGDGLDEVLETVVPVSGDLEDEHDALMGEAKLEVADFADVVDEVFGVVQLGGLVVREGLVAELVEEDGDVGFFEDDFAHGDEGGTGCFGVFYEVFPAVGVFFLEDDGGYFFGYVSVESAHAVAGDKGHHVVFERDEIIRLHRTRIVSEKGASVCGGV